ncbi:MAG TPA: asparagine synthase (glutamine-hydrolyzing) [Pseudolabrys sp.]|nr:asparagine synthase (glutamine-hydrolyzing) [Pseudolabrys sp.]
MCGIAGLIDWERGDICRRVKAMIDAIAYRGPDGADVWSDAEAGIALGHRRLAIVDLTPTGAQPMASADGRWVISYNGEVYNAEAIAVRPEMTGLVRRGTSDTEIIVESVARRGLDATLADLNGMFAIALWDRATRTLHLVRDRLGIKPLFYATGPQGIAFASELKSFGAAGFAFPLDQSSVASFLRFGYVPAPLTIYRGVVKVMPGEIVSFAPDRTARRRIYWSLESIAAGGLEHPFTGSDSDAIDALDALLTDAVAANMISDVPLGAFLSGGIDSSTVVALMVAAKRGPVRTFSIGFPDFGYDESPHARAVAAHLGTVHEELTVTAADALSVVPRLAEMYDEPFADSSQIPTYAISKMTRARVTVALSGDGGDELFAGYNRYVLADGRLAKLARLPVPLRRGAAVALQTVPDGVADLLARLVPSRLRPAQPADKLKKLAEVLRLDGDAVYLRLVSQCPDPAALTHGLAEHPVAMHWPAGGRGGALERMQLFDMATYLPDDILQKVDRASMAVSLEVRPPLLDHRVVEFAWALPPHMRIRGGETKWLLRRVLDRHVPRALIDRPKMGFGIPLAAWLRGPLRDWAENLLDPQHLGGGMLDTNAVRTMWSEHVDGRRNWAYALWTVLMFEAWRRRWASGVATSRMAAMPPLAAHGV